MNGFEENFKLVAADAGIAQQVGGRGLAGEQQNPAVRNHCANLNGSFDAGHAGHDDIAEEDIRVEEPSGFDGRLATIDSAGFKSTLIQDDAQSVGDDLLVIGDEHSGPAPIVATIVHGGPWNCDTLLY